jgi:hypothetical protein
MPWKKNRRLRGLRAIPAGNEGSYPFDSYSLRLAINPVKGTRSPQPVENLMEHLLRRYLSQSNANSIATHKTTLGVRGGWRRSTTRVQPRSTRYAGVTVLSIGRIMYETVQQALNET